MMLRRIAQSLARLVGLVFSLLGAWVFVINVVERSYSGGTLSWILVSGLAGAVGGLTYLLSFDGPPRFRFARVRFLGWLGMVTLAILPTSLSLILLIPMVLLTVPSLFTRQRGKRGSPTSDS